MADWIMWLIAAGVLVALELFSGTFYLLMLALGALAGALVAALRIDIPGQMLAAAVVGIAATVLLRRSRYGRTVKTDSASDPSINLDIGQSIEVALWSERTARVMYRGALWDVELAPGMPSEPGMYVIREVRGSRLIVSR
ncbi:membrane protein implicated in regulation of membrane protease activity [Pseudoduganella lurida]|uniref:Membrane protein implicated in regulation of membrane protease activity n=1 Tax=Pseudoduganella lurida TaxID=1036180 RepID=A0A562RF03_9BURK|nr:NfeD family protein [Pseudoduganella lurida]TWI67483.1 membrane protein implicated in regulation of membrane protease activity [Pseudoduganella lurida]